jgi:hypothetical protein
MMRTWAILALLPALSPGQVVFSRRVYAPRGQTYQQIWNWNPADGSFRQLTRSNRNHYEPRCADRLNIRFLSGSEMYGYEGLWNFNRQTGEERKVSAETAHPAAREKLPEWPNAAFTVRSTPPAAIGWSPDRNWFLAGTLGVNHSSTNPQSDYFVLAGGGTEWFFIGSGNDAMWIPGRNQVLYSSPRDLVPLTPSSRLRVWSAHLMIFDPATRRQTAIPSGVSNNLQPVPCQP